MSYRIAYPMQETPLKTASKNLKYICAKNEKNKLLKLKKYNFIPRRSFIFPIFNSIKKQDFNYIFFPREWKVDFACIDQRMFNVTYFHQATLRQTGTQQGSPQRCRDK